MNAAVIAIGDEMTTGQRLDTNSQWVSQQLMTVGIPVRMHLTVPDDLELCVQALEIASRADVAILTGGLGPTADDLTRDALARATGCPLQLDEELLQRIRQAFTRSGRQMPPRNRVQALMPRDATAIPNRHGTAPGIDLRHPATSTRIIALPGVPHEMKQMWRDTVGPSLVGAEGPSTAIRMLRLKCFGVGESTLEQMISEFTARDHQPTVGITVHQATITLRLISQAASADECQRQLATTERLLRERLGDLVFGSEDDELQHAVHRQLRRAGKTAAAIEIGAAGLLDHWLSQEPTDDFLCAISGVSPSVISRIVGQASWLSGGISEEMAAKLAERIRSRSGADLGLALLVPPAADAQKPAPPRFFVAIADGPRVLTYSQPWSLPPEIVLQRSVKFALDCLRKHLMQG